MSTNVSDAVVLAKYEVYSKGCRFGLYHNSIAIGDQEGHNSKRYPKRYIRLLYNSSFPEWRGPLQRVRACGRNVQEGRAISDETAATTIGL